MGTTAGSPQPRPLGVPVVPTVSPPSPRSPAPLPVVPRRLRFAGLLPLQPAFPALPAPLGRPRPDLAGLLGLGGLGRGDGSGGRGRLGRGSHLGGRSLDTVELGLETLRPQLVPDVGDARLWPARVGTARGFPQEFAGEERSRGLLVLLGLELLDLWGGVEMEMMRWT